MNELKIFENQQFGQIRTTLQDGEPWFVAADVCRALDVGNPADAVSRLDEDEKNTIVLTEGIPGNPNKTIINEPGLYSLVLGSRKPEARAFKRWITHEVIPSIRKTGSYTAPGIDEKKQRAEAMLMNAKTRTANMWYKLGGLLPESPQHKQICASYASEALTGRKVIALPVVEKTYSAEEVGKLYSITSNMVGRIANKHGLKTDEYGVTVMDKAKHCAKEVPSFRYNERGAAAIGRHLQD